MALDLGTMFAKFRVDDSGVSRDLNSIEGKTSSFFGALGGKLTGMAALGIAKIGTDMVSLGIQTAGAMENADIAFTTMLGSAAKAKSFISDLQKFAAATPFEFPELQTAASSLISIGIDAGKVIPIMTTLGNVTSGMGTGSEGIKRATVALQQMNAAGKIQAEDLNQLRDAGIPVYDLLAAATGKSKEEVAGLAQAGKLGKKELDAMMEALASGKGMERFNGLMEKQSASLLGMWSTFQDSLAMGMNNAMQPVLPALKSALGGLSGFLSGTLFPGLAAGVQGVMDVGAKVVTWIQGSGIPEALGESYEAVKAFFGLFGQNDMSASLAGVGSAVAGVNTPVNSLKDAAKALMDYWSSTWTNVQAVVNAVLPVVMPLLATVGDVMWNQIIPALAQTYQAFAEWGGQIQTVITEFVQGMMTRIQPMVPTIQEIFRIVGSIISDAMALIRAVVGPAVQWISDMWKQHGDRIMDVVAAAFGGVLGTIKGILGFISEVIKTVMAVVEGDWSGAWEHMQAAGARLLDAIKSNIQGGMNMINAAIGDKIAEMVAWFKGIPDKITGALGNVGNLLRQAGLNIMNGFLQGMRDKWSEITGWVGGLAGWIADHKGPLPYDYALLQPAGRAIMSGLGDSMIGQLPSLESDLQRVTRTIQATGANLYSGAAPRTGAVAGSSAEEVTLVDRDGTFIARMRKEARAAVDSTWAEGAASGRQEGASL